MEVGSTALGQAHSQITARLSHRVIWSRAIHRPSESHYRHQLSCMFHSFDILARLQLRRRKTMTLHHYTTSPSTHLPPYIRYIRQLISLPPLNRIPGIL